MLQAGLTPAGGLVEFPETSELGFQLTAKGLGFLEGERARHGP